MGKSDYIKTITVPEFQLWKTAEKAGTLLSLSLELTARCNNNCIHCYINLSENDEKAKNCELSLQQIKKLIDEAESLGTLWVLLSGGEPLLREDFFDIYLYIKKKGMLVSVFTNATLINETHIQFFKKYPPRALEITIYGISERIHKKITRNALFRKTMQAIDSLKAQAIPITLKTVIMKSNLKEFERIYRYCEKTSDKPIRFDPFLNLRYDRNPEKNKQILSERLTPDEIIAIEAFDQKRMSAIESQCVSMNVSDLPSENKSRLLRCSAGVNSCCISYDGIFKLCNALNHNDYIYDLKNGSLVDAWKKFPKIWREKTASNPEYIKKCANCTIYNLCMACPANSDLETGVPDAFVNYFCDVANKRYNNSKK